MVLRGRYGATVAVMLLALCPELLVSSGTEPLQSVLTHDLHASTFALTLASSLSDAGYALGAVIAVDLVQRFPARPLYVGTLVGLAAGGVVTATASGPWQFGAGRVIDGVATGLLLVLALPPLVTTFGARRLPTTMAVVNIGLFGAATAGPLVASGVASTGAWRQLFAGVAVVGAVGALLTWRTLPVEPAFNPDQPVNPGVFPLAAAGTVLPFVGASELTDRGFASPLVWAPFAVGVGALGVLIVTQYRRRSPLIPVRKLSSTLPIAGTVCAMIGGAAFVIGLEVIQLWMLEVASRPPLDGARLLWPGVLGVAVAALAFTVVLRTRWLVGLVAAGLILLVVAAGLLLGLGTRPGQGVLIGVVAALLGLGAGMTVTPGLFTAALSLSSSQVGRAVGLVELLRAEAAFALAPLVTHIALRHGSRPGAILGGLRVGSWIALVVAAAGLLALGALLVSGRVGPQRPALDAWLDNDEPALGSPQVADAMRSG